MHRVPHQGVQAQTAGSGVESQGVRDGGISRERKKIQSWWRRQNVSTRSSCYSSRFLLPKCINHHQDPTPPPSPPASAFHPPPLAEPSSSQTPTNLPSSPPSLALTTSNHPGFNASTSLKPLLKTPPRRPPPSKIPNNLSIRNAPCLLSSLRRPRQRGFPLLHTGCPLVIKCGELDSAHSPSFMMSLILKCAKTRNWVMSTIHPHQDRSPAGRKVMGRVGRQGDGAEVYSCVEFRQELVAELPRDASERRWRWCDEGPVSDTGGLTVAGAQPRLKPLGVVGVDHHSNLSRELRELRELARALISRHQQRSQGELPSCQLHRHGNFSSRAEALQLRCGQALVGHQAAGSSCA